MTSQVVANRPSATQKRRKPRRQSGAAVAFESKGTVVQKTRVQRTDSDKVIRRRSMERKMSVRNSIKLPQDFLDGLKGLDDSVTRLSLTSVRGMDSSQGSHSLREGDSAHGTNFTQEQLDEMSKQALDFSDSDSEESVEMEMEDTC